MKFTYEDLISGDAIPVAGIGHFRSPYLYELNPTKGIGFWLYDLYLNVLSWDKDSFLKFVRTVTQKKLKALENEKLDLFDAITLVEYSRELLQKAMAFFVSEEISWDANKRQFVLHSGDSGCEVGYITRDNFEEVRDMMLQLNYVNLGNNAKPIKHSSQHSKELWELAQQKLKENAKKSKPDKNLQMGNIISKLCATSCGYTLLNIQNLTIFQLYDQFFQYGYLRAMELNERAFTIHGGEKFDMQDWLKPVFKN